VASYWFFLKKLKKIQKGSESIIDPTDHLFLGLKFTQCFKFLRKNRAGQFNGQV